MKITATRRNAQLDNLLAQLNNGYIRVYSGTKPTNADTALAGNTLLAELRFSATAFPSASAGSATANAITQDSSADASGTASFVRCFASDGTTVICDLTVGTSGADINFATLTFTAGVAVQITSLAISQPDGT